MDKNIINDTDKRGNEKIKIEWLGIDGMLILLYIILGCIYSYGIIKRIDFIIGILAPLIAITITCLVFFRYCYEVYLLLKSTKRDKE